MKAVSPKDLSPVSGSPNTNTDTAVVKVAMLSKKLQNRSSELDSASVTAFANLYGEARPRPGGYAVINQDRKARPTYPEGPRPHQSPRASGNYPPYAERHVSFPEPYLQYSSTSPLAT